MIDKKNKFIYKNTNKTKVSLIKKSLRECNKEQFVKLINYAKSLTLITGSKGDYNKNEELLYSAFELELKLRLHT